MIRGFSYRQFSSLKARPHSLTREHEDEDFIEEYVQAYIEDITAFLSDKFNVEVARYTVGRALKQNKIKG